MSGHHGHDHGHDHGHGHGNGNGHRGGLLGWLTGLVRPHTHDAADSLDSALESSARGIRAVKISLVLLAVTAAVQLLIVLVSGSVALAADTIHNFSDAGVSLVLWAALSLGRRPANRRFTWGYTRAEDLAALVVTVAIAASAVIAGVESVRRLLDPAPVTHLGWVALAGMIGCLGNEAAARLRIRVGRQIGSAALIADGLHARTDAVTSLAVVAGAGGVAAGFPLADPIVGLVITAVILGMLRTAARDVFRRLMDAVDPALVDAAETALTATPGVTDVRQVRLRWLGHTLHAEADLNIDGSLALTQAHAIAHDAEHRLTHEVPRLRSATIHAYPAGDQTPTQAPTSALAQHP